MSASTVEHTVRPRRSRTRSRTVNARPALALSTLKPHQYDLRPACASLVCPDCETWVPITGLQTRKPKLVPHDAGRAGKDAAVRCRLGSNRLVAVDVTVRKWQERLENGHAETAHRRRTTVRRKPKIEIVPAVSQITPAPLSAATALDAYREHLRKCRKSSGTDHCGGTRRCADGARLAALYAQLLPSHSVHDRVRTREARVDKLLASVRATKASKTAEAEWTKHHEATTAPKTELAKRSGTAIEGANNSRKLPVPGTLSHLRGIEVPLKTLRPEYPAR